MWWAGQLESCSRFEDIWNLEIRDGSILICNISCSSVQNERVNIDCMQSLSSCNWETLLRTEFNGYMKSSEKLDDKNSAESLKDMTAMEDMLKSV